MTPIADAKRALVAAIDTEVGDYVAELRELQRRLRESADDAAGLNGLPAAFSSAAETLEAVVAGMRKEQTEYLSRLGVRKEPITERGVHVQGAA